MTSENKAPDRIWAWEGDEQDGWENAYATVASDTAGSVEYVRADLFEASAAMASRQNALIDTLRDELAKEKEKSERLVQCLREAAGHAGIMLPRWSAALQPDPDARQADLAKAWMMGREDAVGAAKHAGLAFGYERAVQAIRALTPPADLAAKIGGAE